jgi:hypothetical protein
MWEKLKIRERERMLGMLFAGVCLALFGYVLFVLSFTFAAKVVGITAFALWVLFMIRCVWRHRKYKPGKAPVGALSPDERLKAQAKLLKNRGAKAG